ncbi:MAG TPA: acyl-CoA thioesterase [Deltaproteobacteria bacterium]|nr:acyl-CoA thioesterase [Deltaproteobacteria bacterium]
MEGYAFSMEMSVRDYECDLQGIVNNAVYQSYLEHVRHCYLKSLGLDFAALARRGVNLVVVRVELDYKWPLTSGERFVVGLNMERRSRLRFAFRQDIYRLPDERPVLKGLVIGTGLDASGRPAVPEELDALLPAT